VTKSVEYQYDALGRRIGKSVDDNGDSTMDRRETFVYDGVGLLADATGSIHISGPNGALNQAGWTDQMLFQFTDADADSSNFSPLATRYLYGPAVDQIFAVESASGDPLWALTDHQGTPRDWVEQTTTNGTASTVLAQHIRYTAFGSIHSITDGAGNLLATSLSPLATYTGQLYDADAGLMYYRARWYDPVLGKFLNDDPMGFAAGDANVSRLTGNTAFSGRDPSGLDTARDGNVVFEGHPDDVDYVMKLWEEIRERAKVNEKLAKETELMTQGDYQIRLVIERNSNTTLGGSYETGVMDIDDLKKFPRKQDGPFMQQAELLLHEAAEQYYKVAHDYEGFDLKEFFKSHRRALEVEGLYDGWIRQERENTLLLGEEIAGKQAAMLTWYFKNDKNIELEATTGVNNDGRVIAHGVVENSLYKLWKEQYEKQMQGK
jgi:RHS repeat-associated protein